MQITTIEGINSDNYDQPGFYYTLTNNNNSVTVLISQEDEVIVVGVTLEVSMDGNRWFNYSSGNFHSVDGVTAVRLLPENGADFIMQISEYASPVRYMAVG